MLAVECLDANVVQDLMSGALEPTERMGVLGHLDTCADCRELLTITAEDTLRHQLVITKPYPDSLVKPRPVELDETQLPTDERPDLRTVRDFALDETMAPPTGDIALDATMAPNAVTPHGLAETVASEGGALDGTMKPSAQLVPPRRAQTAPTTGKPFGRYVLEDKLGAGAMGVVWRAHDPKLGRQVALKLLRKHDVALVDRLVREAQSMAQVSHPNVVGVYDVGSANGGTYIAMELVEGKSLRAWQAQTRRTVPELVAAYVAAGRGLAAAHAAGIIHRDFKPDNVLVGDDGRIRVTDFGLAAAKPSDSGTKHAIGDVNLTTSGSVLGTPAYMAPEQFAGGNVDPRTDQFNFCAALYEALYGERPFEGKQFDELSENVCEGRIKPAPAGSEISAGLRAIVVRGLQPKPGDRFPTMAHLLVELGRDRARPWRRTSLVATALAAALALGLVSDWAIRDRVAMQIHQQFKDTGGQLDKTVRRLRDLFFRVSEAAYREPALRDVAGHHDQAEFGLGTAEADQEELERLHQTLVSAEFVRASKTGQIAIVDSKGRLLYTSYAPQVWNTDMRALPQIKTAIDAGKGDTVVVLPYSHPALAATHVFGSAPPSGLAVMFLRVLALGDKTKDESEARAIFVEIDDARVLLDEARIDDDELLLALVAPDGTSVGDDGMTPALIAAAPINDIARTTQHGNEYEVQALNVVGLEGQGNIAKVVMARRLGGVLELFPKARIVFAFAAIAMLGVAIATWIKARQITGARVV